MTSWNSPILARRSAAGTLDVNPDAMRVSWSLDETHASDAHEITVKFSCRIRALPEQAERVLLGEAMPADLSTISVNDAAGIFRETLQSTLAGLVPNQPASHWLSTDGKAQLADALRRAASGKAFGVGMETLAPFEIEIDSPTVRRKQKLAGQMQRLNDLSSMLDQFESTRKSSPGLSAGQLLSQFAQGDQAEMVQALQYAKAEQTKAAPIWAVAGSKLVYSEKSAPKRIELTTELGPFRSVTRDGSILWIGARSGLLRVDANLQTTSYPAQLNSQLGFSRVVVTEKIVFASHSEAGLFSWSIDEPGKVERVVATGVRTLSRFGDGIVYSTDNQLFVRRGTETQSVGSSTDLVEALSLENEVLLVKRNGSVSRWRVDTGRLSDQSGLSVPSGVISATLLPWLDEYRLVVSLEGGAILIRGLNDSVLTHVQSPYGPMKMLRASAHTIAGVPEDRQRIVLWNPWDIGAQGAKIAGEIHVTALTGHRVADLCFG